jgi:hypothetical protein
MPTDYGDIVDYHRQESAKYLLLSKAARARGEIGEAEYLAGQSARYLEAVRQQEIGKQQEPGRVAVKQMPRRWPPEPELAPSASARLPVVLRAVESIVTTMRHAIFKRRSSFQGLLRP